MMYPCQVDRDISDSTSAVLLLKMYLYPLNKWLDTFFIGKINNSPVSIQ